MDGSLLSSNRWSKRKACLSTAGEEKEGKHEEDSATPSNNETDREGKKG